MLKNKNSQRIVNFINNPVGGWGAKSGNLFGVELEVEGRNVKMDGVPTRGWKRVAEGSLRGEAIEYVFSGPVDYKKAVEQVDNLFKLFRANDVRLKNSHRTSTHVHLNFGDKTAKQAITFFIVHTILEELLAAYCGETRRGNLFCLSSRTNEELVDTLKKGVFTHQSFHDFGEGVRYCAANLAALNKFGTIEIRTMRGADDEGTVKDWLHILNQLYVYSTRDNLPAPARLLESLSNLGADRFLAQFFDGASIIKLLASWKGDLHASLMDGVRLVQMFAYQLDDFWDVPFVKPEAAAWDIPVMPDNPRGRLVADNPRDGFSRAARDTIGNGRGYEGNDALYTPHIPAGVWFIAANKRDRCLINGRVATYNPAARCYFYDDTGEPIRYAMQDGRVLTYTSVAEREANAGYYRYYGIDHEEEDEMFDEDFDEGEE